jgi:hypothetical protein
MVNDKRYEGRNHRRWHYTWHDAKSKGATLKSIYHLLWGARWALYMRMLKLYFDILSHSSHSLAHGNFQPQVPIASGIVEPLWRWHFGCLQQKPHSLDTVVAKRVKDQGHSEVPSLRPVRHVQHQASQLSGTWLPDHFSCDAWCWTCPTGRGDRDSCIYNTASREGRPDVRECDTSWKVLTFMQNIRGYFVIFSTVIGSSGRGAKQLTPQPRAWGSSKQVFYTVSKTKAKTLFLFHENEISTSYSRLERSKLPVSQQYGILEMQIRNPMTLYHPC